jgi:hypothetical protein
MFTAPAMAENSNSLSLDLLYFNYQEFDTNGASLNHETGYLPGLTAILRRDQHEFKASIYDGTVDYDGYTQSLTPHQTDTDTTLFKLFYRYNFQPNQAPEPYHFYLGISHQYWLRSIQDNNGVYGLDETYTWLQLEAGLNATLMVQSNKKLLLDIGLLHMLNSKLSIDLNKFGFGSPELQPGNKPGLQAEVIWQINTRQNQQLELGIKYSYWSFGKSNSKTLSNSFQSITIEEPRSESSNTLFYIGLNNQF